MLSSILLFFPSFDEITPFIYKSKFHPILTHSLGSSQLLPLCLMSPNDLALINLSQLFSISSISCPTSVSLSFFHLQYSSKRCCSVSSFRNPPISDIVYAEGTLWINHVS